MRKLSFLKLLLFLAPGLSVQTLAVDATELLLS